MADLNYHAKQRDEAERLYKEQLDPDFESEAWHDSVAMATDEVEQTLAATSELSDISGALKISCGHSKVLRFLLAPPLSQDQFALACPGWKKQSEKSGKALDDADARSVARTFGDWLDSKRVPHIPLPSEVRADLVSTTAHLIAVNEHRTARRMRLAQRQEMAVIEILRRCGWKKVEHRLIDQPGMLGHQEFMHATQFATADGSTHEVDVAIGLKGRRILAIECKVSNDRTNSIKRINDVLKKATAWRNQWGKFVITGAVLQGVFGPNEPRRLVDADVALFWQHDLRLLESELRNL